MIILARIVIACSLILFIQPVSATTACDTIAQKIIRPVWEVVSKEHFLVFLEKDISAMEKFPGLERQDKLMNAAFLRFATDFAYENSRHGKDYVYQSIQIMCADFYRTYWPNAHTIGKAPRQRGFLLRGEYCKKITVHKRGFFFYYL